MSSLDTHEGPPAKRRKIQLATGKRPRLANRTSRPFRFFDLPRELRDHVYDLLLDNSSPHLYAYSGINRFKVVNGPHIKLLLVNTLFGHEYTEQMQRSTSLYVDIFHAGLDFNIEIPRLLSATCTRVALSGDVFETQDIEDIAQVANELTKTFANCMSLTLNAHIWQGNPAAVLETLARCRQFSGMKAFSYGLEDEDDKEFMWTKDSGAQGMWQVL